MSYRKTLVDAMHLWIWHNVDFMDRVPSRDALNTLAREVLGDEYEKVVEHYRSRANKAYAEHVKRPGVIGLDGKVNP